MTLVSIQALVDDLVRDKDQVIASASRDTAIANALIAYSEAQPRELVEDATSDGSPYVDVPAQWVVGQSILRSVEYPIGELPPRLVDDAALGLYNTPGGWKIAIAVQVQNGDTVRVTFTAPHVLDNSIDTIPAKHARAVACLAAADLCGQLQSYYASEGMPTISADSADHQGKSDRYQKRRRDLLAEYNTIVGTPPADRVKPASAVASPERTDSLGRQRLFHPVRNWPVTP